MKSTSARFQRPAATLMVALLPCSCGALIPEIEAPANVYQLAKTGKRVPDPDLGPTQPWKDVDDKVMREANECQKLLLKGSIEARNAERTSVGLMIGGGALAIAGGLASTVLGLVADQSQDAIKASTVTTAGVAAVGGVISLIASLVRKEKVTTLQKRRNHWDKGYEARYDNQALAMRSFAYCQKGVPPDISQENPDQEPGGPIVGPHPPPKPEVIGDCTVKGPRKGITAEDDFYTDSNAYCRLTNGSYRLALSGVGNAENYSLRVCLHGSSKPVLTDCTENAVPSGCVTLSPGATEDGVVRSGKFCAVGAAEGVYPRFKNLSSVNPIDLSDLFRMWIEVDTDQKPRRPPNYRACLPTQKFPITRLKSNSQHILMKCDLQAGENLEVKMKGYPFVTGKRPVDDWGGNLMIRLCFADKNGFEISDTPCHREVKSPVSGPFVDNQQLIKAAESFTAPEAKSVIVKLVNETKAELNFDNLEVEAVRTMK